MIGRSLEARQRDLGAVVGAQRPHPHLGSPAHEPQRRVPLPTNSDLDRDVGTQATRVIEGAARLDRARRTQRGIHHHQTSALELACQIVGEAARQRGRPRAAARIEADAQQHRCPITALAQHAQRAQQLAHA